MNVLLELDQQLFVLINQGMSNLFFDYLMPILRNKYVWIPFYVWVISYLFYNYSLHKVSYYLLFIVSTVAITDMTAGQFLKKSIHRSRPCHETQVSPQVELRVRCSRSYSFPSAHAANHFGLAMILSVLIGTGKKKFNYALFVWAGLISFAQVYVGIHYPSDVILGGLLGLILVKLYVFMIHPILQKLQ